jgi:hypothetical protein
MMRKIAIGLAAAVIATGGLTLSASAYRGGPGHGGYAKGGMYRTGHVGPRSYGMYRPERYGHYRHYDHWRHHWRPGYSNYGTYYGGGGGCWRNIWTSGGWTRQWVCGYGKPYGSYGGYGGGYYRHWHGPRYGHWGGGPRGRR